MEIREVGDDGSLQPGVVVSPAKRVTPVGGSGGGSSSSFGAKTIGFWSSCCLNLNNVMGAAIVALPLVNQQAGWLTPTVCILFVFVVSSFAATMLVEAMQVTEQRPGCPRPSTSYPFSFPCVQMMSFPFPKDRPGTNVRKNSKTRGVSFIQRIPGNGSFGQRWEFCAVTKPTMFVHFYAYALAYQYSCSICLICLMHSSRVSVSQWTMHDCFAKTGSGETYRKTQQDRTVFSCRSSGITMAQAASLWSASSTISRCSRRTLPQ